MIFANIGRERKNFDPNTYGIQNGGEQVPENITLRIAIAGSSIPFEYANKTLDEILTILSKWRTRYKLKLLPAYGTAPWMLCYEATNKEMRMI